MSLAIWLPLINNLNNQGIYTSTITNSNCTIDTNGKIGSCYSFNGSTSCIEITCSDFPTILNGPFSVCMWVYNNDNNDRSILFGNYNLTGSFFNIEKYANNGVRFWWNGNPDINLGSAVLTSDTWSHLVVTRNGNTVKVYVNGELKQTSTSTLNGSIPTNATIFRLGRDSRSDATALKGKINDFRLYNHELSIKEIKEIYKSLICHFPLDCNGIGVPNLVDNSFTFNGWSVGSGWVKGSSDIGATYSFSRTGATANNWVRLIPTLRVNGNDYPDGITVSMDLLTPDVSAINQKCLGSLQQYDSTGARTGWTEPAWDLSGVVNNKWCRVKYTFTKAQLLTNSQGLTYSYTMFSFQLVQNGNISIRRIKIEGGNKATDYRISKNDENTNVVYDTSGYNNNGTVIGTLNTFDSDSPKYNSCTYFGEGCDNYIQAPIILGTSSITMNLWIKSKNGTTGKGNYHIILAINGGYYEMSIPNDGTFRSGLYVNGTRSVGNYGSGLLNKSWHMLTITFDGSNIRRYIDAVLVNTTVVSGALSGGNYNIHIGRYNTNDTTYGSREIYKSDVRIYATALSANDILELYNKPISIDNNGNTFAMQYNES